MDNKSMRNNERYFILQSVAATTCVGCVYSCSTNSVITVHVIYLKSARK